MTEIVLDNKPIYTKLADELGVKVAQVERFAQLFDEGASVPFIARYRKHETGGLDDAQLRSLEKSLVHERDLAERRAKIIHALTAQNQLTDELSLRIHEAGSKLELEEIYQPYRPRRRSVASRAILAGLQDIALAVLSGGMPKELLAGFEAPTSVTDDSGEVFEVDFSDLDKQLNGVQAIILDIWAQSLDLLDNVRIGFNKTASIHSLLVSEEKREAGEKFKDYFDHKESFARLPNHRLLAMLRGRQQNVLAIRVEGEDDPFIARIVQHFNIPQEDDERSLFLQKTAERLWHEKWRPQIEHRLLTEHRLVAEANAIEVFAQNLSHLLMSPPAGRKVILGVDPGIRHGVKMAVIDRQGDVIAAETVYPFAPYEKIAEAKEAIASLISKHDVELVAIGNGTASRESELLVKQIIADNQLNAKTIVVNEAGASVYSASELASHELAELDVSLRGAVSIARRLQDPLSELVKVEPKAIGVGQYQHDVNQTQLADSLDKVTQDCVNAVGVDVNTASPAILSYIAGLNRNVAQQIVDYRRANGAFVNREQLKNVPRLGAKTFEQAAGFLRIKGGSEPLDATGVHPESYGLVYEILHNKEKTLNDILNNRQEIDALIADDDRFSRKALVLAELAKPAHDPRGEFKTAAFRDDINSIEDLSVGMVLEGVVTNVTNFGCFVDVGVHQEGLVHISEMQDGFVDSPASIVKPQDIVKVRVVSVDVARSRIGFSMRLEDKPRAAKHHNSQDAVASKAEHRAKSAAEKNKPRRQNKPKNKPQNKPESNKIGSFGELLKKAGL